MTRRFVAIGAILISLVMAGCAAPAPQETQAASNAAAATPSVTASADGLPRLSPPTATADRSRTPDPTPSADPTPPAADDPPVFGHWAIAMVRVDGLNVRQEPSLTAGPLMYFDPEASFESVQLDTGSVVLVVGGPQWADDLWWLRVVVDTPAPVFQIGWAVGGTASDPWIEADNQVCGRAPRVFSELVELTALQRLGCVPAQITFDALPASIAPDAAFGGECSVEPGQPSWLLCEDIVYTWVNVNGPDWRFQLHFDPDAGLVTPGLGSDGTYPRLRITGGFGHPDAEACATDALTADGSEALVWWCRSLFFVTDIRIAN